MENHAAGAIFTDQDCVDKLRSLPSQQYESVIKHLASKAPSELERLPFFVGAGPPLVSPIVTPHGSWNVRSVKKHMAVRAAGAMESRRRYIGVKTILEFVSGAKGKDSKHGGKKRGLDLDLDDTMADCWFMIQYHSLREEGHAEDIKFVIEEETSLCRVVHIGKILRDINRQLNISGSQEQMACDTEGQCLMELDMYSDFENALNGSEDPSRCKLETSQAEEDAMKLFEDLYSQYRLSSGCEEELAPKSGDDAPPARSTADRKSEVWKYFGKIQQKQKNNVDLHFAACHECGEMVKADPKKDGTNSLWRHRHAHLKKNAQGGQKKKSGFTTPGVLLP